MNLQSNSLFVLGWLDSICLQSLKETLSVVKGRRTSDKQSPWQRMQELHPTKTTKSSTVVVTLIPPIT